MENPGKQRLIETISATALAHELGITRSAVSQWKKIPAERVLQIEKITGIPRHELRSDLYEIPG